MGNSQSNNIESKNFERAGGRGNAELREIRIEPGINQYAEGSAEVSFGNTRIHVAVSVENELPQWMKPKSGEQAVCGWLTAEYGMLPRSTHTRNRREAASGKQGGRTLEIQRLIGRSARAALDLKLIKGVTFKIDCDVLSADGGTRTASITGAWVAIAQALEWAKKQGIAEQSAALNQVAAVSVGSVAGSKLLDLCYDEDSQADFDLNLVFNRNKQIIEIQGTAESRPIATDELSELISLGWNGIEKLFAFQNAALSKLGIANGH